MNNKGFTLMEMLAVLLILAVVIRFALPGIRAVRNEIYHMQAKSAAVKMADAMRSYYRDTKGRMLVNGANLLVGRLPTTASKPRQSVVDAAENEACNATVATGIPVNNAASSANLSQLFACGYLSVKDFAGLPYTFTSELQVGQPLPDILIRAIGHGDAGRYDGQGWCVYRDSSVTECEEEE